MIQIRASASELEISGDPKGLREIARALCAIQVGDRYKVVANATLNPAPYERMLQAFEAYVSDGPVCVMLERESLVAAGSKQSLEIFASFFDHQDGESSGFHCHHEWFPGSETIACTSRPLVIGVM